MNDEALKDFLLQLNSTEIEKRILNMVLDGVMPKDVLADLLNMKSIEVSDD